MTLDRRLVVVSFLVALPVAGLVAQSVDWLRSRDLADSIQRVVTSQLNEGTREHCESNPEWFLTGLLIGRPRATDPKPGPNDVPPRPHLDDEPYQLFAYDEDFIASSPVGVRFPTPFRTAMRAGARVEAGPYDAPNGTGAQYAIRTGWTGGPCAFLLGRMDAPLHQRLYWWETLLGVEVLVALVFMGTATPTIMRIRAVASAARAAARSEWTIVAPAEGHDELTAVGAALNEASADLRRRIKDVADREDAHRRFVARTEAEVRRPLDAFAEHLAAGPADLVATTREAQDLALHLGNLLVAARLRMHLGPSGLEPVDLGAVARRVVDHESGLAAQLRVSLRCETPTTPVTLTADPVLVEQAVRNLVDNAVRYNRPGGSVSIAIVAEGTRFRLLVADTGVGVSEAELAQMTAIRRFRGDEGHTDRVRQRGLGLALVWEVVERSGLELALRRAVPHGLEAEIRGASHGPGDLTAPWPGPDAAPSAVPAD